MIKLFSAGGSKIAVGIIAMIVTLSFAIIALADGLLLIKVRQRKVRIIEFFEILIFGRFMDYIDNQARHLSKLNENFNQLL